MNETKLEEINWKPTTDAERIRTERAKYKHTWETIAKSEYHRKRGVTEQATATPNGITKSQR